MAMKLWLKESHSAHCLKNSLTWVAHLEYSWPSSCVPLGCHPTQSPAPPLRPGLRRLSGTSPTGALVEGWPVTGMHSTQTKQHSVHAGWSLCNRQKGTNLHHDYGQTVKLVVIYWRRVLKWKCGGKFTLDVCIAHLSVKTHLADCRQILWNSI